MMIHTCKCYDWCTDGTHNTGIKILLDSEEINILAKKLSKVFTNKITNEFTITA